MSQLYQPTPLEQAYSLYLGQQVFGVIPGTAQIQISGRDAVPFLTQSNVDRGILRTLWIVADPHTIGTLTQMNQFQLLLRLVAMAQAGLLNSSMTADTMKSMVLQYSSQQLNLPAFSSVMVPNQTQLMNAYGNYVVNNIQPVPTTPSQQGGGGFWSLSSYSSPSLVGSYGGPSRQINTGFGVSGSYGGGFQQSATSPGLSMGTSSFGQPSTGTSFGMPTPNINSSAPLAPPTQQVGGTIPEGFNTRAQLPTVSVSDAFGDMDPPADAPLPSIGQLSAHGSVDQSETSTSLQPSGSKDSITNTDSFNSALQNADSFHSAPSVQSSSGFQPESLNHQGAAELNQQLQQDDGFESFDSVTQTPMQQAPTTSDQFGGGQDVPMPTSGDDFGGFSTAKQAPMVDESDPFGPLVGSQEAPLSSMQLAPSDDFGGFETADQTASIPLEDEDFGGFEAAADPRPSMDQSDPFGGLPISQDAPLPSLDQPSPQQEEDDDFGGFEDAATGSGVKDSDTFGAFGESQDAPLPSLDQVSQHASTAIISSDESDPFGPLAGSQDAPLPSFGQVSHPVTEPEQDDDFGEFETTDAPVTQEPMSDDFGGFETAEAPMNNDSDLFGPLAEPDSDDFGGFETEEACVAGSTPDESDPFGPLAGSQDAPLPPLSQAPQPSPQEDDDDDFGGFEAAEAPSDDFGGFETVAPAQIDQPNLESDPFGPLAGIQDATLPPLAQAAPSQLDESDDFGGFATAAPTSTDFSPDTSDPFGPAQDAPLPTLGELVWSDAQDDSFGGFEAVGAPRIEAASDDSDPFGPIVGDQDGPLPSLDQFSQSVPQPIEDNDLGGFEATTADADDFGEFEGTPVPIADDSDPFGPLAGSQDARLPSFGQSSQENEGDDFGGFEAAADDSDPFGAVVGIQDAPFPPLGPVSQPVQQDEEDDFGGFEDAAPATANDDSGPFGPMSGTQDAPLPGLGQPTLSTGQVMEDDFGGFAAAPATGVSGESDLFGPINVQPSGQQDVFGGNSNAAPDNEKNDDWGEFDSSAQAPSNETEDFGDFSAPAGGPENKQDEWGAFDSNSAMKSDAPTATMAQAQAQASAEDDEWRAFDSSVPAPAPPADPATSDDWGAFDSNAGTDAGVVSDPEIQQDANDFGATIAKQPDQDDEWGTFDSSAPAPAQASNESDFGDFSEPAATVAQPPPQDHDWGSFDSSAPAPAPVNEEADFGAFNEPSAAVAQPPPQDNDWGTFDSSAPAPAAVNEESDFGDFSEPGATVAQPPPQDDDWGAFDSSAPAPAPTETTSGDDDWGDFDSNTGTGSTEPPATVTQPAAPDDDWGAFDSSAPGPAPAETVGDEDNDNEWGDFDSNTATVAKPTSQDDNWGDFGKATPASQGPRIGSFASGTDLTSASGSVDGNMSSDDEDFGDFEGTTGGGRDQKRENAVQDKIRAYSSQLPEFLLRKSSGEQVDLAECFEFNIGTDATQDPAHKATVGRCLQVLSMLKKKQNSKLPSYWEKLFMVVKEELQVGKQLLTEASSKQISQTERQKIQKPLTIMVSGFAEYLRVVRSIVGTIGDLLLLDSSAMLTIDTYTSTWCSLEILKIPVEIEQLWKEVEKAAAAISIRTLQSKQPQQQDLSLTAIRRRVTQRASSSQQLCELTLTPLSQQDRDTTCSMVSWQGKEFMACSANLLANRCPFYVVAE